MNQIDLPLQTNYQGDLDDQLRSFLDTFAEGVTDLEPLDDASFIQETIDRLVEGGPVYYIAGRGRILLPGALPAHTVRPDRAMPSVLHQGGRTVQDGFGIILWTEIPDARVTAFPIARWEGPMTMVSVTEEGLHAIDRELDWLDAGLKAASSEPLPSRLRLRYRLRY